MQYIIVTQLETTGLVSCKIQGLNDVDKLKIEQELTKSGLVYIIKDKFIEIDIQGVQVLNLLAGNHYSYRIIGQSMIMEESSVGGRISKVEKITWTLKKEK
ncbi:uncharacterized protein LOC131848230 [Achroia grisella]|uniref:uncharacterized protein LOC131848230 n=1 Tax=Achroia grisella TaxID=688607 RepID=UPI0027D27E36|nr:uncharacterized protein LOC131848230 [Achroia grisella]